jgi:hypothetical protein
MIYLSDLIYYVNSYWPHPTLFYSLLPDADLTEPLLPWAFIYHINHDTLDSSPSNLSACTRSQYRTMINKYVKPWLGKHHSEQSKRKMSLARIGDGEPGSFSRQIRQLGVYRFWSKSVRERDNYTCQDPDCNHTCMIMDAHHMKPMRVILREFAIRTIEAAKGCMALWDVNNGKTLCDECHLKYESLYGYRTRVS